MKSNNELQENTSALLYKMIDSLIYYKDSETELWLGISAVRELEKELFQQTHNQLKHLSYARTYECLTEELYFFNLLKKLYEFICVCSQYQLCQTSRHKLYSAL